MSEQAEMGKGTTEVVSQGLKPVASSVIHGTTEVMPLPGGWSEAIQSLALTLTIAIFVITFVVQAFQIPSESMEKTLLVGDYLLVDKVHFGEGGAGRWLEPYRKIQRGEIIVFRYPIDPRQHFVKRVIGVFGDHVRLAGQQLWVNGLRVLEPYVSYQPGRHSPYSDYFPQTRAPSPNIDAGWYLRMPRFIDHDELVVPPGQYFVLGDNRNDSLDSRYWGFVPRENIIGRPLVIYLSVHKPHQVAPEEDNPSGHGRLQIAYTVTHLFPEMRWDRMLRLVK